MSARHSDARKQQGSPPEKNKAKRVFRCGESGESGD